MEIQRNFPLKSFNTFGLEASAASFAEVNKPEELSELFKAGSLAARKTDPDSLLVLGGGSNILFTVDFTGLVLKINLKGVSVRDDGDKVLVTARAGENWDGFVEYCVSKKLCGLENLSGIPGSVGASPIQNIGAYGAEMRDCFAWLEAFDRKTGKTERFDRDNCRFGYRDSIFKNELKGRYIIVSVTFRLSKSNNFNFNYRALKDKLAGMEQRNLTLQMVREAILEIRASKLPDPSQTGNAGSFFKNPLVDSKMLAELRAAFPTIVHYTAGEGGHKLAAGWLIEHCGWKGHREGDAGVHKDQALVLVNYGAATGSQIQELAKKIQKSVLDKFGIALEPEVLII
jgi:UDP-N-acetylmuramate dehydrogenase